MSEAARLPENVVEGDAVRTERLIGVDEAQAFKPLGESEVLTHAPGSDGSIELAIWAKDGDVHRFAGRAVGVMSFGDKGENFVVVGNRLHAVDGAGFQGVLSGGDASLLGYAIKYLRKGAA